MGSQVLQPPALLSPPLLPPHTAHRCLSDRRYLCTIWAADSSLSKSYPASAEQKKGGRTMFSCPLKPSESPWPVSLHGQSQMSWRKPQIIWQMTELLPGDLSSPALTGFALCSEIGQGEAKGELNPSKDFWVLGFFLFACFVCLVLVGCGFLFVLVSPPPQPGWYLLRNC